MKEKLYTIEMRDAVHAGDECCFCWLERKLEQENLEFVLGSSYMESDIREQTSEKGFCRHHTKMMYDYGNTLGNAWILKSRMEAVNRGFKRQMAALGTGAGGTESPVPAKKGGLFGRLKPAGGGAASGSADSAPLEQWLRSEESHCYICGRMDGIYQRMLDTFVYMLRNDEEFVQELTAGKGMCLHHFADVLAVCRKSLKPQEQSQWIPRLAELTSRNLDRIQGDIDWLIEKYDYRNKDADWKESRDAVQRTMQKLVGSYPADPAFQCRK